MQSINKGKKLIIITVIDNVVHIHYKKQLMFMPIVDEDRGVQKMHL